MLYFLIVSYFVNYVICQNTCETGCGGSLCDIYVTKGNCVIFNDRNESMYIEEGFEWVVDEYSDNFGSIYDRFYCEFGLSQSHCSCGCLFALGEDPPVLSILIKTLDERQMNWLLNASSTHHKQQISEIETMRQNDKFVIYAVFPAFALLFSIQMIYATSLKKSI